MLPTPKKVADTIKKTIFQSPEERRQEAELNRDVQIRMGKARVRRHIAHQKDMLRRLTAFAKQALKINDEARFRQVGRQLLWTQQDVTRWEKYLLSLELLEARRDQVKSSVDILQAIKAMGESLAELTSPEQVTSLQMELEKSLARATSIDERMEIMMEAMDTTLGANIVVDESALENLQENLSERLASEEAAEFDSQIEAGLREIRRELEDDKK
jgi:membrane-associated HD superfamily phosphohydrolase